jgi:hypothetical protein
MLRERIQASIATFRKAFIAVFLFILYIFGFGITLVFVTIFNRRLLGIPKKGEKTFWREARGYSADINECLRES